MHAFTNDPSHIYWLLAASLVLVAAAVGMLASWMRHVAPLAEFPALPTVSTDVDPGLLHDPIWHRIAH